MTAPWTPFREPLRATLLRTATIAVVVGGVISRSWGGIALWPAAAVAVLWPSLGGHWMEVFFLNWLRPRIPIDRRAQVAARLVVWFIGGIGLSLGMALTAMTLAHVPLSRWPSWWFGGLGFIGVELVAHLLLQWRGRPSFYNGRG